MARIMKAAGAPVVVLVVVVVLLLGGSPGGRCVAAHGPSNCPPDKEIKEIGKEKVIHTEVIVTFLWLKRHYMFVLPLPGFEGVRAEVTTNTGTFPAWFPIIDHCSLDDSHWWEVLVTVMKTTSTALTVTLAADTCLLSCELITDATHTSRDVLRLQNLKLYGKGPSQWKERRPRQSCGIKALPTSLDKTTLCSCTNHPPISTNRPPISTNRPPISTNCPPISTNTPPISTNTPPISTDSPSSQQDDEGRTDKSWVVAVVGAVVGGVVVVVVVVVMVVVVVVLLMKRRRTQLENEEGSQLAHSTQEVQVTRNSLYESFDQYRQHLSGPG